MKTRHRFFFDVSCVFQQADLTQGFVKGFPEFVNEIGAENIRLLTSQCDEQHQKQIREQLAKLNLAPQICYVRSQKEIAALVNQSYTSNRYVFLNRLNAEKRDFHKPTVLIQIDKFDDLLPEKEVITLENYRPLLPIFMHNH